MAPILFGPGTSRRDGTIWCAGCRRGAGLLAEEFASGVRRRPNEFSASSAAHIAEWVPTSIRTVPARILRAPHCVMLLEPNAGGPLHHRCAACSTAPVVLNGQKIGTPPASRIPSSHSFAPTPIPPAKASRSPGLHRQPGIEFADQNDSGEREFNVFFSTEATAPKR